MKKITLCLSLLLSSATSFFQGAGATSHVPVTPCHDLLHSNIRWKSITFQENDVYSAFFKEGELCFSGKFSNPKESKEPCFAHIEITPSAEEVKKGEGFFGMVDYSTGSFRLHIQDQSGFASYFSHLSQIMGDTENVSDKKTQCVYFLLRGFGLAEVKETNREASFEGGYLSLINQALAEFSIDVRNKVMSLIFDSSTKEEKKDPDPLKCPN